MTRTHRLVVPFLALTLSACAATIPPIKRTAIASEQLALAVERVQLTVMELHDAGALPESEYRIWQRNFRDMAQVGLALNQALRAANTKDAATKVTAFVELIDGLVKDDVIKVPKEHQLAVVVALESVRAVLLSISVTVM